jgi:hypothetical protein
MTTNQLLDLLKKEIEVNGQHVYTDRRKTIIEMLSIRGIKL